MATGQSFGAERELVVKPNYRSTAPDLFSKIFPASTFDKLLEQSEFYENMLTHPDFLKIQRIARRIWENQTVSKRKVHPSSDDKI